MRTSFFAVPPALGLVLGVAGASGALGCAHTLEHERESREVLAVADPKATPDVEVVLTEPPAVLERVERAEARPRLSRTVTLGQNRSELTYTGQPEGAPRGGASGGSNGGVVVNNNVIVNNGGGGYYGGGYYGAGRGYGSGVPYGMRDAAPRGVTGGNAWAPTGWEGAGRTAAPGQTPGVGGNWAPAPSPGPRAMR